MHLGEKEKPKARKAKKVAKKKEEPAPVTTESATEPETEGIIV